jgi:hypothetical protein
VHYNYRSKKVRNWYGGKLSKSDYLLSASIKDLRPCYYYTQNTMKNKRKEKICQFALFSLLIGGLLLVPETVHAQQGVTAALTKIKQTLYLVGNAVFGILLIIGIIKVVSGFISNSPNAIWNLLYLVLGVALWFFFNFMVEDLAGLIGGDGGSFNR